MKTVLKAIQLLASVDFFINEASDAEEGEISSNHAASDVELSGRAAVESSSAEDESSSDDDESDDNTALSDSDDDSSEEEEDRDNNEVQDAEKDLGNTATEASVPLQSNDESTATEVVETAVELTGQVSIMNTLPLSLVEATQSMPKSDNDTMSLVETTTQSMPKSDNDNVSTLPVSSSNNDQLMVMDEVIPGVASARHEQLTSILSDLKPTDPTVL